MCHITSEQTGCQRRRITIENDIVCGNRFASGEFYMGNGSIPNGDTRDRLTIMKRDAFFSGKFFQCVRKCTHSAFDRPNALRFDMRDQHQCCGCLKRR
jgi:hypothetical protein